MQDVTELAEIQRGILEKIAGSVKVGGKLVYAVCTLARPETHGVVDAFAAAHPEFEPVEMINPARPAQKGGRLELLPQEIEANRMFVAAWRRE